MNVRDIMTTDLVRVDRGEPLSTAVGAMLEARAGSVIVTDDDIPVGIVTSSDVLRASLDSDAPLDELGVARAMSRPLVTVQPTATVTEALELMGEHGIRKLPVVEELRIRGIVTTTDIARRLPDRIAEIRRITSRDRQRSGGGK